MCIDKNAGVNHGRKKEMGMSWWMPMIFNNSKLMDKNVIVCDPKHKLKLTERISGKNTLIIGTSRCGHH